MGKEEIFLLLPSCSWQGKNFSRENCELRTRVAGDRRLDEGERQSLPIPTFGRATNVGINKYKGGNEGFCVCGVGEKLLVMLGRGLGEEKADGIGRKVEEEEERIGFLSSTTHRIFVSEADGN